MSFVPQVPSVSFGGSGAYQIVNDHFDNTTAYADSAFSLAQNYALELSSLIKDLVVPDTSGLDVASPYVPEIDYSSRPTLGSVTIPDEWPDAPPSQPVLAIPPTLPEINMPVMSFSPPAWDSPDKPTKDNITTPGDVPVLLQPDVPVAPSIVLPDAPNLQDIILPSPPSITLPEFSGTLPDDVLTPPAEFNWEESPYNSDVWYPLLDNVLDGLQNGGTGLAPEVEAEIWSRAKNRTAIENDKALQNVRDTYGAKGYDLPPGALASAETEIHKTIVRSDTDLSSDIAVKQAELAKEHTQFITEKGINLEGILRDFHNTQANRTLDAARELANGGIAVFNAKVAAFSVRIERYKAEAIAYDSRVKAALTEIEIFKGMVESAKVSSDIQKNLVDIYEAQISALDTRVKMYATQMESVKIAAEIEQTKLETFKLETEAYIARMQGEKIKFDLYGTEVEAEKVKAQTYAEQVRSFVAEVEAKRTESDLNIAKLDTVLKSNQLLIEGYRGELSGYVAEVDAASKKVSAVVSGFTAEVSGYSAETGAIEAMYNAKVKEIEASISSSGFELQKAVATINATTQGYVSINSLREKGTEGIMSVEAQLAAAAMNAVNTSASLGTSYDESFSKRLSHSMQLGESHTYQEK